MVSYPKISIIIPCFNEKEFISSCLDSILRNTYPSEKVEIIVIDGLSEDGTKKTLEKYKERHFIKVIDNPKKITPAALNLGIKNSTGDLIMIASAHSSYPENYLMALILKMKELNACAVGGVMKTLSANSASKPQAIVKILSSGLGVGNSLFRIGVPKPVIADTVPFGVYKREVFDIVGLYDERLVRNHDMELSRRISRAMKKIYLIPDVTCNYFARESFSEVAKNNFQNGYWNILTVYITRTFSSLSIRHFIPLLFLLSLVLPLFLVILSKYFILIPLTSFLFYNCAVLIESFRLKVKGVKLYHLFTGFYVLHFSYALGSIIGLFKLNKLVNSHE